MERANTALVTLAEGALPAELFGRLLRRVRSLGAERLRNTYQTTFWFPLTAEPTTVVEQALLELAPRIRARFPKQRLVGVEWWLSRMYTGNVQVDFHQDRDEKLALKTGRLVHPRATSVLFLNRVRGGLLAVTEALPSPQNPSLAPDALDFELVAPKPNRFACFRGDLTHGVLDDRNAIPSGRTRNSGRLRLAIIFNWWDRQPLEVPRFEEAGVYDKLRLRRAAASRR